MLRRLAGFHCWGQGLLETRFKWRPADPITVMELRAYSLPAPALLRGDPAHGGCSSWIAGVGVSVAGARAALSDAQFGERQAALRAALAQLRSCTEIPVPAQ